MKRTIRRVLPHIAGSLCIAAVFFVMFLCIVYDGAEMPQNERNDAAEELPAEVEIGEPMLSTQPETPVVLYDVPLGCELQHYIVTLAKENGIDPAIIFGMIKRESNFNAGAIGDGGDSEGLMQIQKKWHSKRMDKLGCNDLLDPFQNVAVGIDYLAEQLDRYDGDMEKALTGYNQGSYRGVVTKYAKGVLETAEDLRGDIVES